MTDRTRGEIAAFAAGENVEARFDEPMSRHTTFRIGGPAAACLFPGDRDQLSACLDFLRVRGLPFLIVGNGSNLLVADRGVDKAILFTEKMAGIVRTDGGEIAADCGALLSRVAVFAKEQGLTGLEFAQGIPGTAGAGVYMNCGAYDGEMAGVVSKTEYLDGDGVLQTLQGEEHRFSYRLSVFAERPDWVITRVFYALAPGDRDAIDDKMRDFARRRQGKQPLEFPSAGSVFKRPPGYFAGKLIEDCGLKGCRIGGAQVSEKHAGFIINAGGATCADVERLIEKIQQEVYGRFGVELTCEIKRVQG